VGAKYALDRRSAVRQRLDQQLGDPVAPAAAHDEDRIPAPDLAGQPRRRRLDAAGRRNGDPRVPSRDGLGQPACRHARRVRIAAGPDVGDGDTILVDTAQGGTLQFKTAEKIKA